MSPLTPTLPKTPQTLIPAESFNQFPDFANKVQELVGLFDPTEKEKISQEQVEIQQQKAQLTILLEELKLSQKDYDFSDYEERLLFSDSEIENILENEIFRKDGELTELGNSFYEYLKVLTEGKSEELKEKMKRKLVKEFGLEDRVYESGKGMLGGKIPEQIITFENKAQVFRDIKTAGDDGVRLLMFDDDFEEVLDFQFYTEIIQAAGLAGIHTLLLGEMNLSKTLSAVDVFKLIETSGHVGIRTMLLGDSNLSEILAGQDFIKLVKQAGLSGIRALDLGSNGLGDGLKSTDFIELLKQAGLYGIRDLDFHGSYLFKSFNTTGLIEFFKKIRYLGIRRLDISNNALYRASEITNLIEFMKFSGFSGVRSLDVADNLLSKIFNATDFIELVRVAGESGIRNLDFSYNGFLEKFSDFQKQEIDLIAKQYNMKLDYSD
ncbi:MAG: hypothetical protein PHH70_02760 [Candidatus Gracilibacteria bacterium]|nr:hypothetical protein [Candidatus Gracilibacteria bacterium]